MMNERILREYERAPKRWAWNFLAAIICVMLIAWSGTTIELSNVTHNGLKNCRKYFRRDSASGYGIVV